MFHCRNISHIPCYKQELLDTVLFLLSSGFSLQLEKRGERRAEAEKLLAQAQEMGTKKPQGANALMFESPEWRRTPQWWRSSVSGFSLNDLDLSLFWTLGEQENIDKFSKRLVKVTKQHNDECKKLLTLMGVPYIEVLYFAS